MSIKRVFLVVLDSVGVGEAPDASDYGDVGSHTLRACVETGILQVPNLTRLGLFNIQGIDCGEGVPAPVGAYGKHAEASKGKDTTTGHWEIGGIISHEAMPTYPEGFPEEILAPLRERTGRDILCNKPYSGTQLLLDYGQKHVSTGKMIVYTSADSVFQVAAHEDVVGVEELYRYCEAARALLVGRHGVGRVIARPFTGGYPNYTRTANRHDFSLEPPREMILDTLQKAGLDTISVGKIVDIFAERGISESHRIKSNREGMEKTLELAKKEFHGLCFVNLVDFDMLYGHRNDPQGYANALNEFDQQLGQLLPLLKQDDILMITADHGCDPSTPSTDHSREYVPLLVYGTQVQPVDLGIRTTFADIGKTVADLLGVSSTLDGDSLATAFLKEAGQGE